MKTKRTIILASCSPRRKELLEKIGLEFFVDPSASPENFQAGAKPEEIVKNLSLQKARATASRYKDAIIIAADTVGVFRGRIIRKPHTVNEARQILHLLSGKSHRVLTGFSIMDTASNRLVTRLVETRVYFKKLTPGEILNYVKTGESMDKAGAYAIQGLGSILVEKIDGDFYNVVGLPVSALVESLQEFGIKIF